MMQESMTAHESTVPDLDQIRREEELRKMTTLVRVIALFIAVPTVTIGLAFLIYDPASHVLHMVSFLFLATVAGVLAWFAPRIAAKFID